MDHLHKSAGKRRNAEAELQASEARLHRIMDETPVGLVDTDRAGRVTYANPAAFRIMGWSKSATIELLPPGQRRRSETFDGHPIGLDDNYVSRALQGEAHTDVEIATYDHLTNVRTLLSFSFLPIRDQHGEIVGMSMAFVDVSEKHLAEEALRESEARLRAVYDTLDTGIVETTLDGNLIGANIAFCRITGYDRDELSGLGIRDILHPDEVMPTRAQLSQLLAGEISSYHNERRYIRKDGSLIWADVHATLVRDARGRPSSFLGSVEDITRRKEREREREELQRRLQQKSKMEAIGGLAGGIAHDFNNLVGAINGFAGFLAQDLPAGSNEQHFAVRILMACEHATAMVAQILAFARAGRVERRPVDVTTVLRDSGELLRGTLPSSTDIEFHFGEEVLPVCGNDGELSQVVVNLCINANNALNGEPGAVTVDLSRVRPGSEDYCRINDHMRARHGSGAHLAAGRLDADRDYARLSVADTGIGIDPEILPRIFEPFFTTKTRGRGTGLGLAAVHGIVMSYDGGYYVESVLGGGTCFQIYLPLVEIDRLACASMVAAPSDVRGHERILIVDDAEEVADVLAIGLDRLGYEVVAVNDPFAVLEAFSDDPMAWDAVVSDQTMPGMTGLTLIGKLKALRPDLKAILCTGFTDGTTERSARELGVECLLKPIGPQRLAARIRVLMDHRDGSAGPPAAKCET